MLSDVPEACQHLFNFFPKFSADSPTLFVVVSPKAPGQPAGFAPPQTESQPPQNHGALFLSTRTVTVPLPIRLAIMESLACLPARRRAVSGP
jgi:hypothetical protein